MFVRNLPRGASLLVSLMTAHFILFASLPVSDALAQRSSPEARAVIQSLSPEERREFRSMSRQERRAFIRRRLQNQSGGQTRGGRAGRGGAGLNPTSPREAHERAGLFNTGVEPIYPGDAVCLEVKSFFGDETRYDGSSRVSWAYHGYHQGFDISADQGTPVVAIADGEVVHAYAGRRLVGNQIYLRHSPQDTGLPVWIYSKYKHFRQLPDLKIGDRVKMGQVLGASGLTGTTGGYFGDEGYPHLHMSVYVAPSGKYRTLKKKVAPKGVQYLDPLAIYLLKDRKVSNNHEIRALPKAKKTVRIPYKTTDGRIVPAGTKLVWPFMCKPK